MDDLNRAVMARETARAQVLRKALAACRLAAQAEGLPPTEALGELEVRRVLHHMVQTLEAEAQRLDFEAMEEQAATCRQEMAVLAPYLWLPFPPEALPTLEEAAPSEGIQRLHHRLNVGPEFTAGFYLMDEAFQGIRLLNVGAGGCCLQVDAELGELLQKGSLLHNFRMAHPDLPPVSLLAEVVYLLGKVPPGRSPARDLRILVGLRFLNPPPDTEIQLEAYVAERLGAAGLPVWPGQRERIPRWDTSQDALLCAPPGPGCSAACFLLGEAFQGLPVLNVGAGGCCLHITREMAELLKPGTRLHNLSLHHPELPADPQHGEVVYIQHLPDRAVAGIHFLHPKVDYQSRISQVVRHRLRAVRDTI